MKETKHWYLPLDKHEGWLRQWILEDHKEWRNNVYGQCKSWLDMGLQPRAVSRDLDWGIPVPVEGAEGKVLYVWFDAPIGYISNTKELLPDRGRPRDGFFCRRQAVAGRCNPGLQGLSFPLFYHHHAQPERSRPATGKEPDQR
jgi:methionyl-tRNA synthetase